MMGRRCRAEPTLALPPGCPSHALAEGEGAWGHDKGLEGVPLTFPPDAVMHGSQEWDGKE